MRDMTQNVRDIAGLRAAVADWRSAGLRVALIPTMGALHAGHMALLRAALMACERVVVSIFVNPTQFAPDEDFSRYPRQEAADQTLLAAALAAAIPEEAEEPENNAEEAPPDTTRLLLYMPTASEIYPPGFACRVAIENSLNQLLEARHRPGHFDAVATVVAKLLLQVLPDAAFFGEKDWQQLQIVRRMVRDLDIPTAIIGVPTVREHDGLALSSRNAYLTAAQRQAALALPRILQEVAIQVAAGAAVEPVLASARARLLKAGFTEVDYIELADAETLAPLLRRPTDRPARVLAAARIGETRLIDNLALPS